LTTKLQQYNQHTQQEDLLKQQIFCPAPDCQVSVPIVVIEKYLGIRKQQAQTCHNKIKQQPQQQIQQHEEIGISKKCPGCAKLVSFVPDKSTTANDMIKISHTVDCGNGHFFCWECRSVQGHAPVACTLWEKWLEKCAKMDNMGAGKKGRI
jgi:ankyrin repeat/IBR domain-containing protein 1